MNRYIVIIYVFNDLWYEVNEYPFGNMPVSYCILKIFTNYLILHLHYFY